MLVKLIITSETKSTKMKKIESDCNSQGLAKKLIFEKGIGWSITRNGRTSCEVTSPNGSKWYFMDQN